MMPPPRPYRDEQDLERMKALLVLGRQAANGTYYVHTGDLDWWLYYPSAQGLYRSIGFQVVTKLWTYRKNLE